MGHNMACGHFNRGIYSDIESAPSIQFSSDPISHKLESNIDIIIIINFKLGTVLL